MSDHSTADSIEIRQLPARLGKPPESWQRRDLIRLCRGDGIKVINFRYPSFDCKLRELRLPVNDLNYVDRILAAGERVDGSSLFPGLFPTEKSDLYAVPVYRWAFINPWKDDELEIVCRFADADGKPSPLTPDNLLASVAQRLRSETGLDLLALAELEFYLILDRQDDRFTGRSQRSYHQSSPYLHGRPIADEILRLASQITGRVKYCHSEVGYIDSLQSEDGELDGRRVEQYELEMDLMPIEDLGCWLTVLRWLIREVAYRHGASVTFVPKLDEGMAGSGMHLHLALEREGKNILRDGQGELAAESLGMIGGLLRRARSLTAFGNTVASSYLRLVPGQEAPTNISWGVRNRSSLVRIPLDFSTDSRLDLTMNPEEKSDYPAGVARPTVEYRTPDGSAYPHLLLAALTLSILDGLSSSEAVEDAKKLRYGNFSDSKAPTTPRLEQLPESAVAAASALQEARSFYESGGFPGTILDLVETRLQAEADAGLSERLQALPAAERLRESRRLMHKDLHKN